MHWPAPVKEHFVGRGKLLSSGVTIVALVFAVLVAKWIGVAILVGVILLLLVGELWIEDARSSRLQADFENQIEDLTAKADGLEKEVSAAQTELVEAAALRTELADRDDEIEELKAELASPAVGFEALLESLGVQLTMIDLTDKHRAMKRNGVSDCPVVRVTIATQDESLASVEAYVGDEPEQLVDEWVQLVVGGETHGFVRVTHSSDRQIRLFIERDQLPERVEDELARTGSVAPTGMKVQLAGLLLEPYSNLDQPTLERVRGALDGVAVAVRDALRAEEAAEDDKQLEAGE